MKIGRKNKEYSYDPRSFLSGTHDFDPIGAMKSWFDDEDEDDQAKKKYMQAGGDAGGLEGIYNQSLEEMDQPYGSTSKGPLLPTGSSEDIPWVIASQMGEGPAAPTEEWDKKRGSRGMKEHGLDTEASRLKAEREFNPALASLGHQADPSLWDRAKTTASSIGSDIKGLFSSDEDAQVPAAVAQQSTRSPHGPIAAGPAEQFEQRFGTADRHPGMPQSLLATPGPGMEDYDDDLGFATEPEEDESLFAKAGSLMSRDSSKNKPLSKGKQAGIKIATDLLTGSNRNTPIQRAPVAGVKMGSVAFPGLLAASQRPVNPRYTPKGLG